MSAGRVHGKVAIVTGAGSGIGAAMARALAAEGASVVVADVSGAEEAVAAEVGGSAVHADVTVEEDVRALMAETVDRHGRIDVVCNNAGTSGDVTPLHESSLEDFERVMAINVRGVWLGTRHALPQMLEQGSGAFVNTASVAGLIGFPQCAPYCASKSAVVGLTRVTAVEYAERGIRANAVCPGLVKTPLLRASNAAAMAHPRFMPPAGRLGEPEEIGAVAVFLAGDESRFLTGAAVPVDGAYTAV